MLIKLKNYVDLTNFSNSLYFGKQTSSLRLLFSLYKLDLNCMSDKVHEV